LLHAWPPFFVADVYVLGESVPKLHNDLIIPEIDKTKVMLRLLSSQHDRLVPQSSIIRETDAFQATEMYHVDPDAVNLEDITQKICETFALRPLVYQVVFVSMFASFPTYGFSSFTGQAMVIGYPQLVTSANLEWRILIKTMLDGQKQICRFGLRDRAESIASMMDDVLMKRYYMAGSR
jgi:hypothetical protein